MEGDRILYVVRLLWEMPVDMHTGMALLETQDEECTWPSFFWFWGFAARSFRRVHLSTKLSEKFVPYFRLSRLVLWFFAPFTDVIHHVTGDLNVWKAVSLFRKLLSRSCFLLCPGKEIAFLRTWVAFWGCWGIDRSNQRG